MTDSPGLPATTSSRRAYFPELLHCVRLMQSGDLSAGTHSLRTVNAAWPAPTVRVIGQVHSLIYVDDQYLWSSEIVGCFAKALTADLDLHLIAIIPHHPDQDGRLSLPLNLVGRQQALADFYVAGGERVAGYGVENQAGTPVYVHVKVCVVDDVWASVGSDNVNRRSWTHDSETVLRRSGR